MSDQFYQKTGEFDFFPFYILIYVFLQQFYVSIAKMPQ